MKFKWKPLHCYVKAYARDRKLLCAYGVGMMENQVENNMQTGVLWVDTVRNCTKQSAG